MLKGAYSWRAHEPKQELVLRIRGGKVLRGTIRPQGSKNGALPLIAASAMIGMPAKISNVVPIRDIRIMLDIFVELGGKAHFDLDSEVLKLDSSELNSYEVPWELAKQIHASFDYLGALIFRFGKARVPLPGGCILGYRGVDFHLEGLNKLGAKVKLEHGIVEVNADILEGGHYFIKRSSVGATKNLIMAALRAKSETVLANPAREPEVDLLIEFLNRAGADIRRLENGNILIKPLNPDRIESVEITNYPDRIEAGTYILACLATGGSLKVIDVIPEHLESLNSVLESIGVHVYRDEHTLYYELTSNLRPVNVVTAPYPGFPTDLQPPLVSFLLTVPGTSRVKETIFDNRFAYVPELLRLGAKLDLIDNHNLLIYGGETKLEGAPVQAPDIRAGAALVIAGLIAENTTTVENYVNLDRGYWKIDRKLKQLGADIQLIERD